MTDPAKDAPNRTTARRRVDTAGQAVAATLMAATVALGTFLGVTGCTAPYQDRQPAPTITDPAIIKNAVSRLCYAFHNYTVDDLARPAVEGDIEYLAGLQGVPEGLATAAVGYWDDARVRTLTTDNRKVAESRAGNVSVACRFHDWKPGQKASDQPPKR